MTAFSRYLLEAKNTLRLAIPLIISQMVQMSIVTIDSIMAGWDSDLTLAAISQGVVLWDIVALILIGTLMPMTARVARAYTQDDGKMLQNLFQQALWLAAGMSIVGIGLMYCIPTAMHLVGVEPAIVKPATAYLNIITLTIPFIAFYLPVRFFNEGIGNPKPILLISLIAIPINIIGNTIFIYGLFGLPKMGAAGIAISSVISQVVMCCAIWWYLINHKKLQTYQLLSHFSRPCWSILSRYLQLGLPNAVALLLEIGMFACVVLLAGRIGVTAAAANQITFNYVSNIFMIPLGISMALSARVGMAMGENNLDKARIIGFSGIVMGASVMMISVMLLPFLGRDIAALFSHDEAVIATASTLLMLAAISQTFDGIQVCSAGALRGLEETQSPMYIAIIGYWILAIPIAIVLAFYFELSVQGLWIGLIVGLTTAGVLGFYRFHQLTHPTNRHPITT